ncbi:MAG: translation elongation factor Ts [Gammaproteobacteria bacterium]|nr:translation elongation factor Ts [Gammaproteobacteria bacterium]
MSASMVKELRERTGAGMMECKKALVETDGDIDAAIEMMRKSGMAKADKKAGRVAAEGTVVIKSMPGATAIVEVNSETDFVANGDEFQNFAKGIAECVLADKPADVDALNGCTMASGSTVDETRRALISKLGENIAVRRFKLIESAGTVGSYLHGSRIGVVVTMDGGEESLAKDLAMHVAASRPACISEEQVSKDILDKEREIFSAQAKESGKPEEIVAKMVEGRIKKFLKEITLVGQPFVKDPDTTVEKLLKANNATVTGFERFEVGEGIEKKSENFAEEVMAQVKGG